jgi:tRNA-splicing ligase RtcB
MWLIRGVFEKVLSLSWERLGLDLIYDVAHNIAKVEFHEVDGKKRRLCVHRKGATRAFASGNPELSEKYRPYGQPVIVPGDMGTNSYIMVGNDTAMKETFGSVCHGAGRILSRTAARKRYSASGIIDDLHRKGITIMAKGKSTIIEEASGAYKDIDQVVECVVGAGLGRKVARMRPLGVVKG